MKKISSPYLHKLEDFKIIAPALLAILLFGYAIFCVALPMLKENLIEQKKKAITNLTQTSLSILDHYESQVKLGVIEREQAQDLAKEQIRKLRYGAQQKDYFWINDTHPRMIMHPYLPELEKQDLSDYTDKTGKLIFVEIVEYALKKEANFVPYYWQWNDSAERISPKLSYVKLFSPWGWVIGTGLYIDDVTAEINNISRKLVLFSIFILVVVALILVLMIRKNLKDKVRLQLAEQELANYQENLENLVEKRTNELTDANKALIDNEVRYRSLSDASFEGIIISEKGIILEANSTVSKNLDYQLSELIGKEVIDFIAPEERENVQRKMLSGYDQPYTTCCLKKDGSTFPVETHARMFSYKGKEVRVSAVRDITEQRRTENELKESHERLANILNSLNSIVYVADMDTGEVLFINSHTQKLFGDITGGICWQSLQVGQTGPCDFCTNKFLLDHNGKPADPYIWESQNTVTGQLYQVTDKAITWFDSRIVRLCFATDISDKKKLEEELIRTKKLEATAILAGGIAHDFNNLLSIITGYIEMTLGDLGTNHRNAKDLDQALIATRRANDLTMKFITFSKGGAPDKKLSSVKELVMESAASIFSGEDYSTKFLVAEDLWQVATDQGQMSQVFKNVLLNAKESMAEGGEIIISAENISSLTDEGMIDEPLAERQFVKLTITDEGIGIPEITMQNIYDPYFSTKERGAQKGMGLGLTIALSIVKQHDGHLVVKSEENVGTSVCIYIPSANQKL